LKKNYRDKGYGDGLFQKFKSFKPIQAVQRFNGSNVQIVQTDSSRSTVQKFNSSREEATAGTSMFENSRKPRNKAATKKKAKILGRFANRNVEGDR
jgi:hypothetical protein